MKPLLTVIALLTCYSFTHAQQTAVNKTTNLLLNKNIFKFNLTGPIVNSYVAQYERVLTKRSSITFTVGIASKAPLPFKQTLMNDFGGNDDAKRAIETTIFDKQTYTFEYRFYTGGQAPRGFYIAPFLRYTNLNISQDYTFTPSDNILHTAHLNAHIGAGSAGVLLGYQFLLGSHWAIDWWIIGPFIGLPTTGHFTGVSNPGFQDMSATDRANLKSNIESVNIPLWTVNATITDPNQVDVDVKGPYYGIRTMGLTIGYRF